MNKTLRLMMLSLALAGLVSCDKSSTEIKAANSLSSHDGRFDTPCQGRIGKLPGRYCVISMLQLIAHPERYHEKYVVTIGYLVKENGRYFLYQNESSAKAWDAAASVFMGDLSDDYFGQNKGLTPPIPVRVVGRFNAVDESPDFGRLGSLTDLRQLEGWSK